MIVVNNKPVSKMYYQKHGGTSADVVTRAYYNDKIVFGKEEHKSAPTLILYSTVSLNGNTLTYLQKDGTYYSGNITDCELIDSRYKTIIIFDDNFASFDAKSYSTFYNIASRKYITHIEFYNFGKIVMKQMTRMFYGCNALTSLDVSNFDTSKVTSMECMFSGCKVLTSLDVSNFDTSNVTSMLDIFSNCSALTSLDVSNFDISKTGDIREMFYSCKSLTTLDLSNFNFINYNSNYYMSNIITSTTMLAYIKMNNWQNVKDFVLKAFFDNSYNHIKTIECSQEVYDLIKSSIIESSTCQISQIEFIITS